MGEDAGGNRGRTGALRGQGRAWYFGRVSKSLIVALGVALTAGLIVFGCFRISYERSDKILIEPRRPALPPETPPEPPPETP